MKTHKTTKISLDEKDIVNFWNRVSKTKTCWEWTGAIYNGGYGAFSKNSRFLLAHRVSFFIHHGRNTEDLVLHHCDNKKCVNPEHLYEGTIQDNVRDAMERGLIKKLSHCRKGHEFNDANTRHYRNARYCRQCDRDRSLSKKRIAWRNGRKQGKPFLTNEERSSILDLHFNKKTNYRQISKIYKRDPTTVRRICLIYGKAFSTHLS